MGHYQRGGAYFQGVPYQWGNGQFRGSSFPPYRNFQQGDGFGDVFRNVLKFLFPIARDTGASFLTNMAAARKKGSSWKDAAKQSLAPTVSQALSSTTDAIMEKVKGATQSGSGRKRRRRRAKKGPVAKRRKTQKGAGQRRRKTPAGRRRKRSGGKGKRVYKRRRRSFGQNNLRILKSNF